jgi:hypothetical protein
MEHITVTITTLFVLEKKRTATHTTTNRVQNLSPPQNLRRHHHSSERWRTKTITSTPGTLKPPERRKDRANRQPAHSGGVGWTRSEPKSDESVKQKRTPPLQIRTEVMRRANATPHITGIGCLHRWLYFWIGGRGRRWIGLSVERRRAFLFPSLTTKQVRKPYANPKARCTKHTGA